MQEDVSHPSQETEWKRRSRRSFLILGASAIAGACGWKWLLSRREDAGIASPLRRMLELNGGLWQKFYPATRSTERPHVDLEFDARVNGDIGLEHSLDESKWRLKLEGKELTLEDIRGLPRIETTCLFKCIEGWSEPMAYAGAHFSDLLRKYSLSSGFRYVGLETPDRGYYVSLDMQTMLHPQTLLAYELNGDPLSAEHGAPLRLMVPVKYGIKSLKRVGRIFLSNTRPPDYWYEQGYDWYADL